MLKRSIALILALVLALSLCACGGNGESREGGETSMRAENGKVLGDDEYVDILIGSHSSWPYQDNWQIWSYFKEAIGGTINLQAIPTSDYETKITLMMSTPDDLPDIMHISKSVVDRYVTSGAFVAIDDIEDKLPDYTAFWASVPEEVKRPLFLNRLACDGKVYVAPEYGIDRLTNVMSWMYRDDIFKKHNLKAPTNFDEMFEVCMELKKLYPDSYPLAIRNGISSLRVFGAEFKPYFAPEVYYDFDEGKFHYGAGEDTMLEMVNTLRKFHENGLIPPDFTTIKTKTWEELVSTNRGFILCDYLERLDFFNVPNRVNNPDYTFKIMTPPRGMSATGQNKISKQNVTSMSYALVNKGDQTQLERAMRVYNWLYTDEACELLSWGKEGETYKTEDGKRSYILSDGRKAQEMYGINTYGLYQRFDPKAAEALMTEERGGQVDAVLEATEQYANPAMLLAFMEEEENEKADIMTTLSTFVGENLAKFLLGQKPMSEWDAFQAELKNMDIDRVLELYTIAYNRAIGK